MSLEQPQAKINLIQRSIGKAKASYTEEGFYRRSPVRIAQLSNQSQKSSVRENRFYPQIAKFGGDTRYPSQAPSNYTNIVEEQNYEVLHSILKREIQKNRILEDRLKGKEKFIAEMQEIFRKLTGSYQSCQKQLQFYRSKKANPPSNNSELLQYKQENNQLKHLVIRLEEKITQYQQRQNKNFRSLKQAQSERLNHNQSVTHDNFTKTSKDQRSKTLHHNMGDSPQFKKLEQIEELIRSSPSTVANFITQFMSMVECLSSSARKAKKQQRSFKRRLKMGWKWIKSTVVEWKNLKTTINKFNLFISKLKEQLRISDDEDVLKSMEKILNSVKK